MTNYKVKVTTINAAILFGGVMQRLFGSFPNIWYWWHKWTLKKYYSKRELLEKELGRV